MNGAHLPKVVRRRPALEFAEQVRHATPDLGRFRCLQSAAQSILDQLTHRRQFSARCLALRKLLAVEPRNQMAYTCRVRRVLDRAYPSAKQGTTRLRVIDQ